MEVFEKIISILGIPALLMTVVGALVYGFKSLIRTFQREIDRLSDSSNGIKEHIFGLHSSVDDIKEGLFNHVREEDKIHQQILSEIKDHIKDEKTEKEKIIYDIKLLKTKYQIFNQD